MVDKIFDLGICFFEGYIYFTFWNHFLKLRTRKLWFPVTVMALAMSGLFLINQMKFSPVNLVASITISLIAGQILFADSWMKKVFYALLVWFIMVFCEFVMMGIFSLPIGEQVFNYDSDSIKRMLVIVSTKLLTFLVIQLICRISDYGKNVFFPSLVSYFYCFPVACLILSVGLSYSDIGFGETTAANTIILIGCILLLLSNMVLFIAHDRMTYMMNRVKEYELTEVKRRLENQHYLQIDEINQKHSATIHDMNGYLKTIETLAKGENNEEIVEILHSLNQRILKTEEENYCNNHILNAILSGKKQEAILKKVEYQVLVEPGFEKPEIDDIDLISIMSNLIDNAIEAASKCQKGVVKIRLFKANDGRFTALKVRNNYQEQPVEKEGEFITSKPDSKMHGIGLRHVKAIVENYGGFCDIEYGDYQFLVTVMFARQ